MQNLSTIRLGFWSQDNDPLINKSVSKLKKDDIEFIRRCKEITEFIADHDKDSFVRGYWEYQCIKCEKVEKCKICDKLNGNKEITFFGYTFPQGYLHYIIDHNIVVDNGFKKMMLRFDPMFL